MCNSFSARNMTARVHDTIDRHKQLQLQIMQRDSTTVSNNASDRVTATHHLHESQPTSERDTNP